MQCVCATAHHRSSSHITGYHLPCLTTRKTVGHLQHDMLGFQKSVVQDPCLQRRCQVQLKLMLSQHVSIWHYHTFTQHSTIRFLGRFLQQPVLTQVVARAANCGNTLIAIDSLQHACDSSCSLDKRHVCCCCVLLCSQMCAVLMTYPDTLPCMSARLQTSQQCH